MAGPRRDCVAQIIVQDAQGRRRASGYLVRAGLVLTAAHVVADAVSIEVRFNPDLPDEWSSKAHTHAATSSCDWAILSLESAAVGGAAREPVEFGRLGDTTCFLSCETIGFPLGKLREEDPDQQLAIGERDPEVYRDAYHFEGRVSSVSNFREGTVEVQTGPPLVSPLPPRSPWEGMSGSAVWVKGRVVAVLSRHYPSDGPSRLAAFPLSRLYASHDDNARKIRESLQLPPSVEGLTDVGPGGAFDAILDSVALDVGSLAPDDLRDRQVELSDLRSFADGDEPYLWVRGLSGAGKTALAATFVLAPPRHPYHLVFRDIAPSWRSGLGFFCSIYDSATDCHPP
jgi:hypothetical protein